MRGCGRGDWKNGGEEKNIIWRGMEGRSEEEREWKLNKIIERVLGKKKE